MPVVVQGRHAGATDAGGDHFLPGTHSGDDRILPDLHGLRAGRQPAGAPLCLSNACKDLRCLEGMANAATVTATMAIAAKNSFAVAMAQGGAGPQDCLLHLTDFVARANGFLNCPLEGLIRMETVPRTHSPTVRGTVGAVNGPVRGSTRPA